MNLAKILAASSTDSHGIPNFVWVVLVVLAIIALVIFIVRR